MWSQETCKCAVAGWVHGAKWDLSLKNKQSAMKMGIRANGNLGSIFKNKPLNGIPFARERTVLFLNLSVLSDHVSFSLESGYKKWIYLVQQILFSFLL